MMDNKKTTLALLFVLISFVSSSQILPPPQPPPPPPGIPIDTNIVILIALGCAYGIYKLYRFKKSSQA